MARTLDRYAHALRRDAFVDVAERMIQTKGYEQMSIQDVLDDLDTSRGAFYHYFESKADLLDSVIDRMTRDATTVVEPVVADPSLSAVQKIDGVFSGIARWKGDRTELLLAVLDVWLADDNAIVREKYRRSVVQRVTPLMARIVAQGQAEGWRATGRADDIARVLVSLILGANDAALELYTARRAGTIAYEDVERRLATYRQAMGDVLGLPTGSLSEADPATLRQWFDRPTRPEGAT